MLSGPAGHQHQPDQHRGQPARLDEIEPLAEPPHPDRGAQRHREPAEARPLPDAAAARHLLTHPDTHVIGAPAVEIVAAQGPGLAEAVARPHADALVAPARDAAPSCHCPLRLAPIST